MSEILGVIRKQDLLDQVLDGAPLDPLAVVSEPLVVHEATPILSVLKTFKARPVRMAVVVDEYGSLVLQLSLRVGFALMALPVTVLGHGLMDAPPQRPAEEMIEHYAGRTLQAANELADLAHAEGDQRSRLRSPLLCDVTALSFTRRAARKPKASMASVMCRYQPCQERIS